jgi:hypothetical protein
MSNSPSSASPRYNSFTSLSSREKSQRQTKPPDLTIMKASAATPNSSTTSILMDVDHRRIGRKIMGRQRSKQATTPPPTRDLMSTIKGVNQRTEVAVAAEAHTQSDLYTACTTVIRRTITPKIAPSTLSQKRRWIKT